MSSKLEFFFDYGSPFSYLVDTQLPALGERTGAEIAYRPMLLGAVFKATGNQSPAFESVENKRAYTGRSMRRWVERYGIPFQGNPHFPINTLLLMRTCVAAQKAGVFEAFHRAVYPAFWVDGLDLGDPDVIATLLRGIDLDPTPLLESAADPAVKDELRATTEEAVARGTFGAPTFFVGDELFFGNDHLFFAEEALRKG